MEAKPTLKKAVGIAANVLLYVFIALCVIGIVLSVTSKKSGDGAATIFGMQMRVVLSPSMEKCDATDVSEFDIKDIPTKSMVFIDVVPKDAKEAEKWYADLKEGDVLTFKYVYVKQETITHRITKIEEKKSGGYLIYLEGDNKNSDSDVLSQVIDTSEKTSPNYVVGKVFATSYNLGLFVSALRSPLGLIFIVILPCLAIVITEVLKIISVVGEEKKKKDSDEKERQQNEIEDLRRRLAELEKEKKTGSNPENQDKQSGS